MEEEGDQVCRVGVGFGGSRKRGKGREGEERRREEEEGGEWEQLKFVDFFPVCLKPSQNALQDKTVCTHIHTCMRLCGCDCVVP